jgi:hypothetical protein
MAQIDIVLTALTEGYSVQRRDWEPIIRIFVVSETLMCQCGNSTPWRYCLGWDDFAANDWQLVEIPGPSLSDQEGTQSHRSASIVSVDHMGLLREQLS